MATRERLAQTSNMKNRNMEYGNEIINKWPQENAWLKRAIWNTQIINKWPQENAWLKRAKGQIFNKWPQENAWLKRAIWNTQIFNKWPQENAWLKRAKGIHKYSINGHKRPAWLKLALPHLISQLQT